MSAIRSILISFILIILSTSIYAQDLGRYSNSNLRFLAGQAEARNDYLSAALYYEELSNRKPKKDQYRYQLARNYHQSSQFSKAKSIYAELLSAEASKYPLVAFYLGRIMIMEGECDQAIEILDQFRKDYRGEKDERKFRRMAKFSIEGCEELKDSSSENFILKALPEAINGANMEGAPIFESNERLIYSSLFVPAGKQYDPEGVLPVPEYYVAKLSNGNWVKEAEWEQIKIPNGYYAVSGAFNPEKSRLYLSACKNLHSSELQCDLFRVDVKGGKWGKPEKLEFGINTKAQERHPAVGIDDKGNETLYFVSDREDGKGGFDLYYSTYYEKRDEYREPRNSGSRINSIGDELSPFIDPESGELYFSSDAHPGYGGLDIFRSVGARSRWKEPENIGSEINGGFDDLYYTLSPNGRSGMFVSNRPHNGKNAICCDDLFYFTDPDLVRLNYLAKVNNEKGELLPKSTVTIYELDDSTGESYLRKRMDSREDATFDFRLEPDKNYLVKFSQDGYFTEEMELSTVGMLNSSDHEFEVELKELSDQPIRMDNVYYEFNETALSEAAKKAIDTSIYKVLIQNPSLIIEIGSHTDSKGQSSYNKSLSQKRAQSVVNYLISKGIERRRLKAKGYGESNPIADNKNPDGSDNPEGRARNRRTEFKVIGKIELEEEED